MSKVLKVTRKYSPELFDEIGEFIIDSASQEHRRGSSFYNEAIVEFKKEDQPMFKGMKGNFSKYCGLWKTNRYVFSEQENGFEDIHTLTRVKKVEVQKTITTVVWAEIQE